MRASTVAAQTVAAIDLGTNSFHLVIARLADPGLTILECHRETVRLGSQLDQDNELSLGSRVRGLECLQRFAQRLGNYEIERVRVVGTHILRTAKRSEDFLGRAEEILGWPVEIISGREEAELIYLGVASQLPVDNSTRLVVDIGGGSTEITVSMGMRSLISDSLPIGCVILTDRFSPNGEIGARSLRAAQDHAENMIRPRAPGFRDHLWDISIGCSARERFVRCRP